MLCSHWRFLIGRCVVRWICSILTLAFVFASGCSKPAAPARPVDVEPRVDLAKPEIRTTPAMGQAGFVYAYEQTAIFPKVAGYV